VFVRHTGELCNNGLNRYRCRLVRVDSCGSKKTCIRWEFSSPTGRGIFDETCVVTYLRLSALRIVRLHAADEFILCAARGDKLVMRPFVRLLRTPVICSASSKRNEHAA